MSDAPIPRDAWPNGFDPWAESPNLSDAERAEFARLWDEREAQKSARPETSLGSSPGSSRVRPQLSSSLRPTPFRGDEDEQFVPDFVPEPHSWLPLDLVEAGLNPTPPPDLAGLFSSGRTICFRARRSQ